MPNIYLQPGQTYTFAATLQNFLGFHATSEPFAVGVAAGSIPELVITAGNAYHMLVPSNLALFAQASGFDPRPTTILSHVNMRLKLGECESFTDDERTVVSPQSQCATQQDDGQQAAGSPPASACLIDGALGTWGDRKTAGARGCGSSEQA